jgi:hypothetical protein
VAAPEIRRVLLNSADPVLKTTSQPKRLLNVEGALNQAKGLPTELDTLTAVTLPRERTQNVDIVVTLPNTTVSAMDVMFLIDTTGSYQDDIDTLQAQATRIINDLSARGIDVQFGVASFADFPIGSYGSSTADDQAYFLNQPITNNVAAVHAADDNLDNPLHSGEDAPESQLEALFQLASGAGLDINHDGDFTDDAEIRPSNAGWRAGALKVVVLATDAPFHDHATEPSYPGPTRQEAIAALRTQGVIVIGLDSGDTGGDLADEVQATGGTLFALSSNSAEIAERIAQAITEQLREVDLTLETVSEDRWVDSVSPAAFSHVKPGETKTFQVTLKGIANEGMLGQLYRVYFWARADNSAVIRRVAIPVVVPREAS